MYSLDQYRDIPVDWLQRGKYQPRHNFASNELEELAESIREQGVIEPLIVRPLSGARYEIVAGERRWRAAQLAGLYELPCLVREYSDEECAAVTLIENLQREDLTPIEEAESFQRMISEFSITAAELGKRIGRSRSAIANQIRLLDLEPQIRDMIDRGELKAGSARPMIGLTPEDQLNLAREVIKRGLNTRQIEKMVNQLKSGVNKYQKRNTNLQAFEELLSMAVGNQVSIVFSPHDGKGDLKIQYHSLDELEGIALRLQGRNEQKSPA